MRRLTSADYRRMPGATAAGQRRKSSSSRRTFAGALVNAAEGDTIVADAEARFDLVPQGTARVAVARVAPLSPSDYRWSVHTQSHTSGEPSQ